MTSMLTMSTPSRVLCRGVVGQLSGAQGNVCFAVFFSIKTPGLVTRRAVRQLTAVPGNFTSRDTVRVARCNSEAQEQKGASAWVETAKW